MSQKDEMEVYEHFNLFDYLIMGKTKTAWKIVVLCGFATILTIGISVAPSRNSFFRLGFLFVLLFSWLLGFSIKTWAPMYIEGLTDSSLVAMGLKLAIPILVFQCTLHTDYHTLARMFRPVLLISFTLFAVTTGVLYFITCAINEKSFKINLVHALILSMVSATHAVGMLDKTQGQVRQLQILLQGEMIISIGLYSYLNTVLIKVFDINQMENPKSSGGALIYALWCLLGIIPGFLAAYLLRQYIKYSYNNYYGQKTCCIAFIIILYSSCGILQTDGTLSVLAFGISLSANRIKFSNGPAKLNGLGDEMLDSLANLFIFFYCGLRIGMSLDDFTYLDVSYNIAILFTFYIMSRIIALMLIEELSNLSLQLNWQHYAVMIQCPARGGLFLGYTLLYIENELWEEGLKILEQNVVLVCMSYMVNVQLMSPMLRAIGMYDLTRAKNTNMNLALSQVNDCRSRGIQALKVDRVIADANWEVVNNMTRLQHPYKRNPHSSFDGGNIEGPFKGQHSLNFKEEATVECNKCGSQNAMPLSKKELADFTLDIKHRILKAQRISFYRQYDNGTLSRHIIKVLTNLIEKVSVQEEPILMAKDLKIQRDGSSKMRHLKNVFSTLFTITSKNYAFIPTSWLRAFCFRLCTSRQYQIIMASLSMVDWIMLLILLHGFYSVSFAGGDVVNFFQIAGIIFYGISVVECLIQILGIGMVQYFYSPVNLVEFACSCLARTLEIGLFLDACRVEGKFVNVFNADHIIMHIKTVLILRVTRVYVFIVALIPKILSLIDQKLDEDLSRMYDLGKAFIITQEQVMKFLRHLVTNEEVYSAIMRGLEEDRLTVAREIGMINYDRGVIAATIKTVDAIRLVVNSMQDCISNMKEEETLDILETTALLNSLQNVIRRSRHLNVVRPLDAHTLLYELPWLKGDEAATNFFLRHTRVSSYSAGEIIISHQQNPDGLRIIVNGLVKTTYIPSGDATLLNSQYGLLPNYDFFLNLKFDRIQYDYISGDSVIGEYGVLSERVYDMTAVCETSVHLVWIPIEIVKIIVFESPNTVVFQAALWKSIGIKISMILLPDLPQFRGWNRERLTLYLQDGVVPVLTGVKSVSLGKHISDVILVEGLAMDYATQHIFIAPKYIPRTVGTLLLPGSVQLDKKTKTQFDTRLFIVPSIYADAEDVSGLEGLYKYQKKQTVEKQKGFREKIAKQNCKDNHGKDSMSAFNRKLIKAQSKKAKELSFVEYVPALEGAIEPLPTPNYVVQSNKMKLITSSDYPRTKFDDRSFVYESDVEENSEIEEVDDFGEDSVRDHGRNRRSSTTTHSRISSLPDIAGKSSRLSEWSGNKLMEGDVEIRIGGPKEKRDVLGSSSTQTKIKMMSEPHEGESDDSSSYTSSSFRLMRE